MILFEIGDHGIDVEPFSVYGTGDVPPDAERPGSRAEAHVKGRRNRRVIPEKLPSHKRGKKAPFDPACIRTLAFHPGRDHLVREIRIKQTDGRRFPAARAERLPFFQDGGILFGMRILQLLFRKGAEPCPILPGNGVRHVDSSFLCTKFIHP